MEKINKIDFFGPGACLHHVGIAVPSIAGAAPGVKIINDPLQKVDVAFIDANGLIIELVQPAAPGSPVDKFIKTGPNLYHFCYRVKDIRRSLEIASQNGFHCLATPVPAPAFNNKKIAWLFSRVYGLVELVEE